MVSLTLAAAAVAVVAVTAVGAVPRSGERTTPAVAASPVVPGLRPVAEISQPGAGARPTAVGPLPRLRDPGALAFPSPAALEAARAYVGTRRGRVSFAVADTRGELAGLEPDRPYRSASLVKAMILVAYLEREAREGREPTPVQRARLDRMIRISDNDSAIALHRDLGPERMRELARRAGMTGFADDGSWSEARVTAGDQARFFAALDRLLPAPHRDYARELLQGVTEEQSWGVPAAARPAWRVLFKGGWRPAEGGTLVHQAARLERGPRTVAIAVLSDGNPDQPYGEETIRQVTARLLDARPSPAPLQPPATPAALRPLRRLDARRAPSPPALRRLPG